MTIYLKYQLVRFANIFFRLIVPIIAAGVIWGVLKKPEDMTFLDQVAGGTFVIIVLLFAELRDFARKTFEQMKIDNNVTFMKNRAVSFLMICLILVFVKMFVDKAISFFFISGISNVVAYFFEYYRMKLYRKAFPNNE